MKKLRGPLIGLIVIILIAGVFLIRPYNKLVVIEENVDQAYSQIDTQLQRRLDLIPNLVNTVKGFASHEQGVIQDISNARANLAGAQGPEEQAAADAELSGALSRLLVVVENYPDLKADKQFTQLMDELAGTENRIAVARKDYNDTVAEYNREVKRFPMNLVAGMFGFEKKEYFKADPAAQSAPSVDFGTDGK